MSNGEEWNEGMSIEIGFVRWTGLGPSSMYICRKSLVRISDVWVGS